jgi:hypothetical protein
MYRVPRCPTVGLFFSTDLLWNSSHGHDSRDLRGRQKQAPVLFYEDIETEYGRLFLPVVYYK